MDQQTLQRLADGGLRQLPPDQLDGLILWCWDRSEITGDARYASVARMLGPISRTFDELEGGGGPDDSRIDAVDAELIARLPGVLGEPEPEAASLLARSLREDVWRLWSS